MPTLTLDRTWVNLLTTGEAVSAYTGRGRSRQAETEGSVQRLAGGRFRSVSTVGVRRTQTFMLRDVSASQLETLEQWVSQTVIVRDNRGRKMYGVYYQVGYADGMNPSYYDVQLDVTEVTYQEGS